VQKGSKLNSNTSSRKKDSTNEKLFLVVKNKELRLQLFHEEKRRKIYITR
jgi:hypothetical protein